MFWNNARPQAASNAKKSNENAAVDLAGLIPARSGSPRNAMTSTGGLTGGNSTETGQLSEHDEKLLDAVCQNDVERVRAALDSGANVNARGPKGQTALHCACKVASSEVVKVLLKAPNIDVNPVDNEGYSPIARAIQCQPFHVYCLLRDHENSIGFCPTSLLFLVAEKEKEEKEKEDERFIEDLIERGADLHATNDSGQTPLMAAISNGSLRSIRALILKGAKVRKHIFGYDLRDAPEAQKIEIERVIKMAEHDTNNLLHPGMLVIPLNFL